MQSSAVDESVTGESVVGPYYLLHPKQPYQPAVSSAVVGPYRRKRKRKSGTDDNKIKSIPNSWKRKHSSSSSSKADAADSSSITEMLQSTTVEIVEDAAGLGKNEWKINFANGANVPVVIAETNNNNNTEGDTAQTRIHLLVDRSGSMGVPNQGDRKKVPRIEIEKRVVELVLQAENENPEELKVNCYELQPKFPLIRYESIHHCGSYNTEVYNCVRNFINLSGNLQHDKKDVIIVMTDDKTHHTQRGDKKGRRGRRGEGVLHTCCIRWVYGSQHVV